MDVLSIPSISTRKDYYLANVHGPDSVEQSDDDMRRRMAAAQRLVKAAPELWAVEEAWSRLEHQLERRRSTPIVTMPQRRRFTAPVLRVAALILLLIGGAALWQKRAGFFGPEVVRMNEYAAAAGSRVAVKLPDGSKIVLGPSSKLWIPERFGDDREVRLEGEAVFDVARDEARPFLVRTDGALTRVLGTRFGVSSFAADGHVDVTVAEGSVAVLPIVEGLANDERAQLTANQMVRVSASGTLAPVRVVDAEALLSWVNGGLAFDRATLAEVGRTLERRFGIAIAFDDAALAQLRLTADFGRALNAHEVLKLMAASLNIEVRRTSDGFLFVHPVATAVPARDGERNR